MPTQHMNPNSELYRAILEYDYQPVEHRPNPNYTGRATRTYVPTAITVPVGPVQVEERMIGPYQSISPIKAYITSNRNNTNNLRLKRIERVSSWEEVN